MMLIQGIKSLASGRFDLNYLQCESSRFLKTPSSDDESP